MGSDKSHFNVSVGSDGQSHKTVSTNHNLFEDKDGPKRYRTEVLPLTSLTFTARPNRFAATKTMDLYMYTLHRSRTKTVPLMPLIEVSQVARCS